MEIVRHLYHAQTNKINFMKKTYLKTILLFIFKLSILSCQAQEYPLNTDHRNIPNYSYLKDLNNELDPYIGTYKTSFNSEEITIFITKESHKLIELTKNKFYRDVLLVRFIVKNSSDAILQDTKNMNFQANQKIHIIYSMRTIPQIGVVTLSYGGTNCGIGSGEIILKKINSTQISWTYNPNSSLIDSATCPPSTDKTVYLPVTNDLIFTKQ